MLKLRQVISARFLDGTTYVCYKYKKGYLCRCKSPWLTLWSEWESFSLVLKDIRYEQDLHDVLPHEVELKFSPVPKDTDTVQETDDEIPF